MAMNVTVMRSASYLLDTCQTADGVVKGPAGYYLADGTWPGRWRGSGLTGIGLDDGTSVGRAEAITLFHQFAHPITGAALGRTPAPDSQVVNGFDLTFRIPKSVSLLWAVADEETRRQIWDAHTESVGMTLDWIERDVLRTRSGRDGVAVETTRGLVAAAFDHFESRDGDPHLHTHVAVANRVQRARDGVWRTIDGQALLRSTVAASERHENLLLDLLHERLGMEFTERPREGVSSKAVVADAAGVDAHLVDAFSSRDKAVSARLAELTGAWSAEHGGVAPPRKVVDALKLSAWASTRTPKKKSPDSLSTLTRRWRSELTALGTDPAELVAASVGHPVRQVAVRRIASDPATLDALARLVLAERATDYTQHVAPADVEAGEVARYLAAAGAGAAETGGDVADQVTGHLAALVHEDLATTRSTWTRGGALAAADRLTRLLRADARDRELLTNAIADAALALCVPLTPTRYQVPQNATAAVLDQDHAVFDPTHRRVFSSRRVLDAEARLQESATAPLPAEATGALDPEQVREALAGFDAGQGRRLALDQASAVEHLACAPSRLAAVVGPAGTGKTTSLRALVHLWTKAHGTGSVLALAPSARAASVLRGELDGVDATTLASFITANTPQAKAKRADWIKTCRTRRATARTLPARARATRTLAKAQAQDASVSVRAGSVVIVDEAAMATTADLDLVRAEVTAAGGRMVLIGDPAQLDAVGAGGILGRLERTGHTAELTSIFRFIDPWQREVSRRLRAGDLGVFVETDEETLERGSGGPRSYADAGWVHDGAGESMLEGAYAATQSALARGVDAVLLVATNDNLTDLNTRATLERRAAGLVDTTRLVRLRGRADAGAGDLLIARRNKRKITDTDGRAIQNGDLLRLEKITITGQAVCRRITGDGQHETGARITLPASYLRRHGELGYALTAHRAQGITVDEAHLVIPDGAHMTRELVYVAMTRARGANHVWCAMPDADQLRAEHTPAFAPDPDGALRPVEHTAVTVLGRALSATTAQSTAHEVTEAETERTSSLSTLAAEHEHLVHLAAEARLRALLTDLHRPDHAEAYWTDEGAWTALVATFARADALDPDRTRRLLALAHHRGTEPVQGELAVFGDAPALAAQTRRTMQATPGRHDDPRSSEADAHAPARPRRVDATAFEDAPDSDTAPADPDAADDAQVRSAASLAHWTLNSAIVRPHLAAGPPADWVTGLTPPVTDGPADILDMARQATTLIGARTEHLRTQILDPDAPDWVDQLPIQPDPDFDPDGAAAWERAALAVAAYRDTFSIDAPHPLGPTPDTGFQARARELVAAQLNRLDGAPTPPMPARWEPRVDNHADPDFDWSDLDPGEVTALTRTEARAIHTWRPLDEPEPVDHEPDPTIDFQDGEGPVLWEPGYTIQVPGEPDWQQPTPPRTSVHPERLGRLAQVNQAAYSYWQQQAAERGSWVPEYLAERQLAVVTPAHAPAGWTSTCDHLRAAGFTDTELLDAGLATHSRRGTLIDRFRDRAAVPLYDAAGRLAGFTARANPQITDPKTPKYLNTPATDLFDKSRTIAGLTPRTRDALALGATPVIVEGALDAAAVTAAGPGVVGLAPCGTALTSAQLAEIADARGGNLDGLVLGFDDDPAGHSAAARAWQLLGPRTAALTRQAAWGSKDPAELATAHGQAAVITAVDSARPLVREIVEQHTTGRDLSTVEGLVYAAQSIAIDVVPSLNQDAIDAAGSMFGAAAADAGNAYLRPDATWQTAVQNALVAYSSAASLEPTNRDQAWSRPDPHRAASSTTYQHPSVA
ncbi:MobF family relaxase [Cellulomonas sp. RIT-PI-Y]|uniref:MobF family relaxase n=1 Tax=Cellulomonas sp. RIT-PI-Y TaxID=3035297 RepID=UPI0021DA6B2F|nr:MobF family relaxase [Cellulomonas sp. RIT-PI-Y]